MNMENMNMENMNMENMNMKNMNMENMNMKNMDIQNMDMQDIDMNKKEFKKLTDDLKGDFGEYNQEELEKKEEMIKNERRINQELSGSLENVEEDLELEKCKNEINGLLGEYENKIDILSQLTELYKLKFKNIDNYIGNMKDNTERNSRTAHFQFDRIKNQKILLSFLRCVYYIIFVFWIIFSDYIREQKYYSVKYWGLIILYLHLPLKINTIVNIVKYIYFNLKKYINIFIYELKPNTFMFSSI